MKWKTKDGREIEVKDMETSHIKNTLKMLEKNGFIAASTLDFYLGCSGPSGGDGAQMAFERECDYIFSKFPSKKMDEMESELKKRGEILC